MIERLFQLSADTGTKSDPPSFTFTRESYDKAARHEAMVLLLNGRVPDYNIRLNYRVEMPAKEIAALWKKHSRRLERAGIVARVAIEITKNKRRTRPVNRVHYHFAVQDTRTPAELRAIVRNVFWYTNLRRKNRYNTKKIVKLKDIPEQWKYVDDNGTLCVDRCWIPTDYKKPFAVSAYPILKGILELGYEVVLDNQYFPYKDGKRKFGRCLIRKKKKNKNGVHAKRANP